MSTEYDHAAVEALEQMHAAGQLRIPEPWINGDGRAVVAWNPGDGDALECYLDMFGLNGRQMQDSATHSWTQAQLRKEFQRAPKV